ncbi:S24 family peptidase [Pseudomonas gingeri]|uniref:S24 family peptidase n=1 Tax=Pseudomonas gingeri TaxID=117681 RepID=A0A7Y7X9V8_9PSED|nr:S24 family peptidase [Pseudomonas gingeri]
MATGHRNLPVTLTPTLARASTGGHDPTRHVAAAPHRSMEPLHGHIVVALLNNDPVCKRLCKQGPEVILKSDNPRYPARYVMEGDELSIWGISHPFFHACAPLDI